MAAGRKIGVLGGAFNPPHVGHLVLAQEALHELELDELLLVPTGQAPHKLIEPEPGPEVRLEMTRLAVETFDGVAVSDIEVSRDEPSWAYRTLELLGDRYPESELTFVMGADAAAGLAGWRRPERVLELARIGVAVRPGIDYRQVADTMGALGATHGYERIEMPEIGISSTMIRNRVKAGKPIRWLVPRAVAELIGARGIYAEGEGR